MSRLRQPSLLRAAAAIIVAAAICAVIASGAEAGASRATTIMLSGTVLGTFALLWGVGAFGPWSSWVAARPISSATTKADAPSASMWRQVFAYSTNHRIIGIQYLITTFSCFLIGGTLAEMIRSEQARAGLQFVSASGYEGLVSVHGTVMIFLFAIPAFTGLANAVIPLMMGARDMALPHLNALSFWIFLCGAFTMLSSLATSTFQAGWTNYTPLASSGLVPPMGEYAYILGIELVGISSILGAVNFITTIITRRAPGMTLWRLPLMAWTMIATSILIVLATPFIAGSQLLVLSDIVLHTSFFTASGGGDPILYQHLFWAYSHPAVYVMVLPGFGVISEVVTVHAQRRLFGYRTVAISTMLIALLSFMVWAHHMFVSGMSASLRLPIMFSSMLIAVPTGIKVFSWIATLWRGVLAMTTPMVYALGFLVTFTIGGLTGVLLSSIPFDSHVHDTYFVVAHLHYVLIGGSVLSLLAGVHHWFPKIFGRMYNEPRARRWAIVAVIATNMTFFPMHRLGMEGMPRRVADYAPKLQDTNLFMTVTGLLLGLAFVITVINLVVAAVSGPRAPDNPWGGTTLEWITSSPPPEGNFPTQPVVTTGPYEYESWRE